MKRAIMREKRSAPKRVKQDGTPYARPRRRAKGVQDKSAFQDTSPSVELKNTDYSTSNLWTTASTQWTITAVNLMAQGTAATNHIGRKVTLKSILVRSSIDTTDVHRMVIIYDKECNGAAAVAADIFAVNTISSPLNLDNSDRFIVLADVFPVAVGNGQIPATMASNMAYEIYRKMALPMIFNTTTTATITAVNCGAIYICTNAEGAAITEESSYVRTRFTDA